jgi:exopolysaccharide production protein ExoQ
MVEGDPPGPTISERCAPWEWALGVTLVLATTLGPVYTARYHLGGGFTGPWEDDRVVQLTFAALYAASIVAILVGAVRHTLRLPSWVLLPIGMLNMWAVLSTSWSVDAGITLPRSLLFAGTTIAGTWIGLRFTTRRMAILVAGGTGIGLVASIAAFVFTPDLAIMQREGHYWAGIYFNRNSLAPVAALALISTVLLLPGLRRGPRVVAAGVAALGGVMLVGAGSRTSLVALGVATLVGAGGAIALRARRRGVSGPTTAAVAVAAGTAATLAARVGFATFRDRLGVDPTIDGRTLIWGFSRMEIGLRRFRGYGFYTYWQAAPTRLRAIGWINMYPATAHNGYLELALGLGLPALALFIGIVGWVTVTAARRLWFGATVLHLFPLTALSFILVSNLMESFTLPNQLLWLLLVAIGAAAARDRVGGARRLPVTGEAVAGANT